MVADDTHIRWSTLSAWTWTRADHRWTVEAICHIIRHIGKQILGNVAKTEMEVVGYVMEGRSIEEAVKECRVSGIK